MKNFQFFSQVFNSLIFLFYPRTCAGCGKPLVRHEEIICFDCFTRLDFTNHATWVENPVAKLFYGKIQLTHAMALIKYQKHSLIQQLLHDLKYHNKPEIGLWFGQLLAQEIKNSPYLQDVEVLIPVPLHPRKLKIRGYNQSEIICNGIQQTIPHLNVYTNVLIRSTFTETQTKKSTWERYQNVKEVFSLQNAEKIRNKHVLIIDDVITTGSTVEACAKMVTAIEGTRVSFASVASPA